MVIDTKTTRSQKGTHMPVGGIKMYIGDDAIVRWNRVVIRPRKEKWTELVFSLEIKHKGSGKDAVIRSLINRMLTPRGVVAVRHRRGKLIAVLDVPPNTSNQDLEPIACEIMQALQIVPATTWKSARRHVNPRRRLNTSPSYSGGGGFSGGGYGFGSYRGGRW